MDSKINYYSNVLTSALPFLVSDILSIQKKENKVTLLILESSLMPKAIMDMFSFLNIKSLLFPAYDATEYDFLSPSNAIIFERFRTLSRLLEYSGKENMVILSTMKALMRKSTSKKRILERRVLKLHIQQNINQKTIISYLNNNGYIETTMAFYVGDFAVRGSIIDISLLNYSARIDFFGNQIESIKIFDVSTQCSKEHIDEIEVFPVTEVETVHFRNESLSAYPFFKSHMKGIKCPGEENWISTFYDDVTSLFEYIPTNSNIIFFGSAKNPVKDEWERVEKIFTAVHKEKEEKYHYQELSSIFLTEYEFSQHAKNHNLLYFTAFTLVTGIEQCYPQTECYYHKILVDKAKIVDFIKCKNHENFKKIIICAPSIGSLSVISKILNCQLDLASSISDCNALSSAVLELEDSFYKKDELLMINGNSIYASKNTSKEEKSPIVLYEAFEVGNYVVHKNHGVAKFEGLVHISINGNSHECIKLTYFGGDVLFVPAENIGTISRYSKDEVVELDKLGGLSWQLKKEHVRKHIQIISDELMRRAARRKLSKGIVIESNPETYVKFCAKFPYILTEDQKNAIYDIEQDLKNGKIMDRLISGDTGFGKTEVLLRAAFLVVDYNKSFQVAVVSPTAMLCTQHFKIFEDRFADFGYRIEHISKQMPRKEIEKIKNDLHLGKVNIIIGTHALIKYLFKNLVLIIIDEEHCFGVKQKEELKKLGNNAHMLTISATPIPRTLQMSLSGIKDLSNIKTPPFDRILPKIFILEFDDVIIKEAILREYKQGGKVFCVVPKISQIEGILIKLHSLLPEEILIKVAHGQMKENDIEKAMTDFYENKFSILLTTTIIQAGIDVPTANTIIVLNAEMFGIATLYQLRGRVGRGKVNSFVYFVVENYTENAKKRLQSIASINNLGSGLNISEYDMDIRGFGNLIGEKQSGKIKDVGVELYQKMLSDAMSSDLPLDDIKINIPLPTGIPVEYIRDFRIRLQIYKTLSKLNSITTINKFSAETMDRFGHPLPKELQNLFQIVELQCLCAKINIKQIDVSKNLITMTFDVSSGFNADLHKIFDNILKIPSILIKASDKIALRQCFSNYNEALNITIKKVNYLCDHVFLAN